MRLVTTQAGLGRIEDGAIALLDTAFPHVGAVLEQDGSLEYLASCAVRRRIPLDEATLVAPLARPRAVWGVGLNYLSKAARAGRGLPEQPILYLAASSAVLAPGAQVVIPQAATEPDYEGEIAVVVGRRLYQATESEVWPAIAGITAANDMTARDVMRTTAVPALAKSYPGFTPLGASICTPDDLPDRDAIRVRTRVNGELVQDDTSAGMIFPVPDLLSRLSWFTALEPGDVVLTGTPAGTGQDRACFLADGDEVRVEVDGVLPLVTRVVRPAEDAALRDHRLTEPVS
ncbi:fumarylacetoacetate hydrolase family protein [Streptomyces himalayensis]|uniref:Fumarylacetoacetate hydrolase family protein n=1 Tax=Streptomyces himalayensis subsp. himalayensis TaxID=2756131 RepID=A0A7W0DVN5_9ACTN|nr:fumarylacetoacetate hydrolase family protein [Streptomyces himalayensis]MBA2951234.1 fumarylacetoacetate hydrolase family protein [Streptomyces himalayensis subsp. himalayensis]